VQVDVRGTAGRPVARLGQARTLAGQDAFPSIADGDVAVLEVSLAALLGDDLRDASPREALAAVMGYAILCDWVSPSREQDGPYGMARGREAQLGPALVSRFALPRPERSAARVRVGGAVVTEGRFEGLGISLDAAIALASRELALRAGDVVALGPLGVALPLHVPLHAQVSVELEGLGPLRAIPVPARTH
jgi:2-keto-4-pentenoate hydratase/2-oxohepta-3-ene-1,7-dioic acid hydratase in catechol pathway